MLERWAWGTLVFVLGLVAGSLANVVIYRLPRGQSVVAPRSFCRSCGETLGAADLAPVVSYLWLRGKCRYCRAPISVAYPLVELLTAFLFLLAWARFDLSVQLVPALVLLFLLVVVSGIDLSHRIIPNRLVVAGVAGWVLASWAGPIAPVRASLTGLVVVGGVFAAAHFLSRGGMGAGDVKLAAMIGLYLGWKGGLVASFLAVVAGAVLGLALLLARRKGRRDAIPFGPFLAAGATGALFWGEEIIRAYLRFFR